MTDRGKGLTEIQSKCADTNIRRQHRQHCVDESNHNSLSNW